MSDLRTYAKQQSVSRATDDTWVALRSLRDGSPIVVPWFQALVLEGRCFNVKAPAFSTTGFTPATLLALASMGDDDNTLFVDIPDGTAFIPLELCASTQATGGAIAHVVGFVSGILNGTGGTETALTPRNLRIDNPVATAATAAHTADTETDHVDGTEVHLIHEMTSFDIDAAVGFENNRKWSATSSAVTPVGVDGSSLNLLVAVTTSGTGWASAVWAELSESAIQ